LSDIKARTDKEFEQDFPINFGKGVRGDFIRHRNKVVGVTTAHMKKDGSVCAGAVFWGKVENRPIWKLIQIEPLTLQESIRCSCGLHGWIRNGQWEHAPDSIQ
jgi:hypothetical protein